MLPESSQNFVRQTVDAVLAHAEHGGWYETEDGLWCVADDTMVIPSSSYLEREDSR